MKPGQIQVMTFEGDDPSDVHFVEVHVSQRAGLAGPAGTTYVSCRCPEGLAYWERLKTFQEPEGCWAMIEARIKLDIDAP